MSNLFYIIWNCNVTFHMIINIVKLILILTVVLFFIIFLILRVKCNLSLSNLINIVICGNKKRIDSRETERTNNEYL